MTCFNCTGQCNRLCPHYIISDSVSVVTVSGTDTLLIDIPTGTYGNNQIYCIVIAQNRPTTATVDMPVAISIGGDTTTVYPLVCNRTCLQATACQVSGRTRLKTIVQTNTAGGVFRVLSGLGSCCYQRLTSLPVTTTTTTTTTNDADTTDTATTTNAVVLSAVVENGTNAKTTRTVTNTTKEVITRE